MHDSVDVIVIGAGVSGLTIARELAGGGAEVVVLEAGSRFSPATYPRNELEASARLYWGGGVELTHDASIGILRPRVVGGGSVVNQALVDRFDDDAFTSWRAASGIDWFDVDAMAPWYARAEAEQVIQTIPEAHANANARLFRDGFAANGYQSAPLRRAQSGCHYERGNSCVECLAGCRVGSKQSLDRTAAPVAEAHGARIIPEIEIDHLDERPDGVIVSGQTREGETRQWKAQRVVLAAGAIGNSALLLRSGWGNPHPRVGHGFFSHPQWMNFGLFRDPVHAEIGPLQSYKSADPGFRRQGFKLENVYAGPASLAMLLPGHGRAHQNLMKQISHLGCIEVCIRDTTPGRITLTRRGGIRVEKKLGRDDVRRRDAGMAAIRNIFHAMGATRLIRGQIGIGLHLMGGCAIGTDPAASVVRPDFRLHGSQRLYAADSSIFPNAPGINPSLTIQALSFKAAHTLLQEG